MRPLLLTLLLAGCVPKGRYELAQIQLEATQTAFQTREELSQQAVVEAQREATDLREDLEGRELQVSALQARIAELERQADKRSEKEALNFFAGVEACPPLPAIPPCPTCEGEPVERPEIEPEEPEVTEKRALVEASIEEVSQALKRSSRQATREAERNQRHQQVFERLAGLVDDGYAEIEERGEETVVRLLVAKLFNENRTTLSPLGEELVKRLAVGLNGLDGFTVNIVGHTDDRPVSSVEYPSNWELGFAYAIGLLRGLEYEGFELDAVVTSLAGTDPVVAEKTKEARRLNRRVELRLSFDEAILSRPVEPAEPAPEGNTPDAPPSEPPEQELGPEETTPAPTDPATTPTGPADLDEEPGEEAPKQPADHEPGEEAPQ